jgi:hypothetical protein
MNWSKLLWPARFTNVPPTKRRRFEDGYISRCGGSISRTDVAHLMLDAVGMDAHLQKVTGVSR